MATHDKGRPSRRLTKEDSRIIKQMLADGWLQSRIAAHFDVNVGRVSEIKTGKTFPDGPQLSFNLSQ